MRKKLLSISRFTYDNNIFIEFYPTYYLIKEINSKKELLRGILDNGIYKFSFSQSSPAPTVLSTFSTSSDNYHDRLGHPTKQTLEFILHQFHLPTTTQRTTHMCHAYSQSRASRLPLFPSVHYYTTPLQLIISDIWGPTPTIDVSGNKYYIIFIDALSTFLKFKVHVENSFN